jgi:type IV secretory pathway TraG/TraD family ATPase VirD4
MGGFIICLTSLMLSKPDGHSKNTWLVLDELGNLPKNDSLKELLSLGRSKGCRLIAGTQSISQLHEKYGEQDTDTILNLFSTVIALRCGVSGGVAEYAAKCFGESIYERPSIDPSKSSSSNNWQKESWGLVTTDDLKHLPQASKNGVTGYITSSGWNSVFKLQWHYPSFNKKSKSHIAASWLTERNSNTSKAKNGRLRNR